MPKNFGKKIEKFAHHPSRTIKNEVNRWANDVINNQRLEEVKKLAEKYKVYVNNHEFDIKIPNPSDPLNVNNAEKIKLNWATIDAGANDKAKFEQLEYALKCVDGVKIANLNNGQNAELLGLLRQLDPIGVIIADRICKDLYNRDNGEYSNLLGLRGCYDYACSGADARYPTKIEYPISWYGVSTDEMFKKFEANTGLLQNSIIKHVSSSLPTEEEQQSDATISTEEEIIQQSEASNNSFSTLNEDADNSNVPKGIEVISKFLGSEVTLTNGAKHEVKKIIDLLDKPGFTKQLTNILSKLYPEDSKLVTKEIALKLAYISNKDIDKYDEVHAIVDNMPQPFIEEFNRYDAFTLDQMKAEEAAILGDGISYL